MSVRRDKQPSQPVVVVADDMESIRTLLSLALEMNGFTPVPVADGRQALEQIRALLPAAAIVDWYMPELDGEAVCREVRAMPETSAIPLIMLTGVGHDRTRVSRADVVIGKPFQIDEVLGVLGRFVREGRGSTAV